MLTNDKDGTVTLKTQEKKTNCILKVSNNGNNDNITIVGCIVEKY